MFVSDGKMDPCPEQAGGVGEVPLLPLKCKEYIFLDDRVVKVRTPGAPVLAGSLGAVWLWTYPGPYLSVFHPQDGECLLPGADGNSDKPLSVETPGRALGMYYILLKVSLFFLPFILSFGFLIVL